MFLEASLSRMEGNLQQHTTTTASMPKPERGMLDGHVLIFTYQHLVHDDTKAPPITELVVSVLHKDLWCDVIWGPHGGECLKRERRKFRRIPHDAEYHLRNVRVYKDESTFKHTFTLV